MNLSSVFVGTTQNQSKAAPAEPTKSVPVQTTPPVQTATPTKPTTQPIPIQYPTPPGIEMSERFPGVIKPLAEELVYEWQAGSRPFRKHTKQFYMTAGMIVILLCLILFFAGQILPIAVVLSVSFLVYVFSAVPPNQLIYRITTYGIRLEEKLYPWELMGRFWFEKRAQQKLLFIETAQFPNRLTLVLSSPDQEPEITSILSDVLLHQKPPLTWNEKAAKWLQDTFPLELEK